jgi:hypothetical protein
LRVGTEFHIHHGYRQFRERLWRSGPGCLDLLGNWYLDFLCLHGGLRENHHCRWRGGNGLNALFYERWRSKWDWLFDRHGDRLNFFTKVPRDDLHGFLNWFNSNDLNNFLNRLGWSDLSAF